jgi:putative tricarboxylic transport membrane protein
MMGCLGLALGCIGWDYVSGDTRITLGMEYLYDGLPAVPVVMGLFGISEVLSNLERTGKLEVFKDVKNIWPSLKDFRESILPILRGSGIGFFLGLLPGGGTVVSTFAAYTVEKKISKNPERFGKGFVPLLTLGIPVSPVFALVFAALLIHGVQPGPLLLAKNPNVFWGVVISMYIGNIILLILNLPLIRMWVKVLEIPYGLLFPLILIFCLIGALSDNKLGDVFVMLIFGVIGYLMKKFDYEPAPMIIAFILELNLRQSLILSGGSFSIFFAKPISLGCLIAVGLLFLLSALPKFRVMRPKLGVED